MVKHTQEQIRIIETACQRVEVLACAGSGKTSTLDARIGRLLEKDVAVNKILVLSFSNTAVEILKSRLGEGNTVKTFHAFSHSLARQHYRDLGFGAVPALLEPLMQLGILRRAVKACHEDRVYVRRKTEINLSATEELQRLGHFYDRMQGDGKLAKELVGDPNSEFREYANVLEALRNIHKRYQKEKRKAGAIDYADMLRYGRKALAGGAGLQYQYLFVDECQDMNRGQAELLRALAEHIPNVMVFGDPLQAVYSFMGGRFWQLSSLMDRVQTYELTRSFRLTQRTADLAAAIGAPLYGHSTAIHGREVGKKPVLMRCQSEDAQVRGVVHTVQTIFDGKAESPSITVLARTKAQLRSIEIGLLAGGFNAWPSHRQSNPDLMEMLFQMMVLARCAVPKRDEKTRAFKARIEQRLLAIARLDNTDIKKRVVAASRRKLLNTMQAPTLQGRYIGTRQVLEKLLRASGRLTADMRAEIGRWEPICNRFRRVSALREYVQQIESKPAVTLSTIHRAKGEEWDHVLVIGLTDGSVPFYREIDRGAFDEERRLLFVAVTRARERLYLFHAPFHHAPSRGVYEEPSRFLTPEIRKLLAIRSDASMVANTRSHKKPTRVKTDL